MSHQSQVPALIAEYFKISTSPAYREFPLIAQTFRPSIPGARQSGWKRVQGNKRVSLSAVRALRASGVSAIAVSLDGRTADFSCAEIIRYAQRPLLGGRLI